MMKNENPSHGRALLRTHVLLIVLIGVLAHGLSIKADWYMDDHSHILQSETVTEGKWADSKSNKTWRVVPYALYWSIHKVFGFKPEAFHALNLLLHIGISLILYFASKAYLARSGLFPEGQSLVSTAALAAAALFACHPLASEAVNYARCTMILLATLFSVLAGWFTLRLMEKPCISRGLLLLSATVLAAFSKESGFIQALALILLTALCFSNFSLSQAFKRTASGRGSAWALLLLIPCAILIWIWMAKGLSKFEKVGDAYSDHILTQGRVFWTYIASMIAPVHLSSDHYLPWSRSFSDAEAVAKTIAVAVFGIGILLGLIKKSTRIPTFFVAALFVPLLIRFLYYSAEVLVEYRVYPSLPWFGVLAGIGIAKLANWNFRVARVAAVVLVAAGIAMSAQRSAVWMDSERLIVDVLEKYPDNNRARTQLQKIYILKQNYEGVLKVRNELIGSTASLGAFNAKSENKRMYDLTKILEARCLSEQITVYAIAAVAGPEAALAHANSSLEELSSAYPQFYFDPETGEYLASNPLVMARNRFLPRP